MRTPRLGLVLSAGGARAAYQVGVLRYLAENIKGFDPTIFTGISAGSINAAFLAQGEPIQKSAIHLYELWDQLEFHQVVRTNFQSLIRMASRWTYDIFFSKITHKLLLRSLLDATPLATTLLTHIQFSKISAALKAGNVYGVAITATNYLDDTTTIFYDSAADLAPWERNLRRALRTSIRVKHIMASCSIPILFEPVPIGNALYGDGSLRLSFPFSPAIQLGSTKVLAISIRSPQAVAAERTHRPDHLSIGFIAGTVLNSIFLDSVDTDFENLQRINRIAGPGSPKHLEAFLIRPSQDLGKMSVNYIDEVPFHLRQLFKSTSNPDDMGDLLSYLMFSHGYIRALLELGMKDAAAQHDKLSEFFGK